MKAARANPAQRAAQPKEDTMLAPRRPWGRTLASAAALAALAGALTAAAPAASVPDPRELIACLRTHPWTPCVP
jgi:hypothetical protein